MVFWWFLSRHKHGLFESDGITPQMIFEVEKGRSRWKDVDGILRCQESGATVNILDKQLPEVGLSQDWQRLWFNKFQHQKKRTQFSIHGFVCFKIWTKICGLQKLETINQILCFFIQQAGESQSPDDIAGVHWWGLARLLSCGLCTVAGARKLAQCRVGLGTKCSWPYGIKKPWSWGTRSSVTWLKLWGPFLKFWVDVVAHQMFEDFFLVTWRLWTFYDVWYCCPFW